MCTRPGSSGVFQPNGSHLSTDLPRQPVRPSRSAPVRVTVGAYGENLTTIDKREVTCMYILRVPALHLICERTANGDTMDVHV